MTAERMMADLPPGFEARARSIPGGEAWVRRWPALLADRLEAWDLDVDLAPGRDAWAGQCAVVVPVVRRDGGATDAARPAVLKLTVPHEEALPEPDALQRWDGHGAVRLLEASRTDYALLLERLDGDRSLRDVPLRDTVEPWGQVARMLSVPVGADEVPGRFPQLATEAEQWTDTLPEQWSDAGEPFPRRLMEAALEICQWRGTVGRRFAQDVLVHSDLHYENLLPAPAGRGSAFTAIDPKPVVGDAEYAVAPMLWNRLAELDPADPAGHLRAHCAALSRAAGFDPELAEGWAVVREVRNALFYLREGRTGDAQRSLWVASSLTGRTLDGLPRVSELLAL